MNGVIAMVRMDLLKLLSMGKSLLLYLLVLLFFTMNDALFYLGSLLVLYVAVYTMSAYDEQSKGIYLDGALPVSRAQRVQAAYLYDLVVLALSVVLSAAFSTALSTVGLRVGALSALSLQLAFLAGVAFLSTVQPLILWLGTTRARWWVLGLYCLGFATSGFLTAGTKAASIAVAVLDVSLSGVGVALAGMAMLVISYLVASRLYGRRQFTE